LRVYLKGEARPSRYSSVRDASVNETEPAAPLSDARGFVSILGSNGGLKIESVKNDAGDRSHRIAK
jgi:hypothetical protein